MESLEFKVKHDGKLEVPRWKKIEAKNVKCPENHTMIVVAGKGQDMYAYCPGCDSYYLAE